ncbi:MAG TPA: cytochrome c3 family protein, partial [Pyrinomonadaceae bacterium]|nr:cytochrome c3 family protein [Pyrinomonadaceae bacterium]
MFFLLIAVSPLISPAVVHSGAPEPQRRPQTRRPVRRAATPSPKVDYSQFSHATHVTTQKLTCDSCHKFPTKNWKDVRKGDAAFPDVAEFPEHSSCLDCHRQQFFARERPVPRICSNCHVKATPRDTTRFLFPSLGDVSIAGVQRHELTTEFQITFPHDKHLDVVSSNAPGRLEAIEQAHFVTIRLQEKQAATNQATSCPVCHQTYQPQGKSDEEYVTKPPQNLDDAFWLKKGTFKSIPNSHTTCFSCHNADLGIEPSPSACHVCHQLKPTQQLAAVDFEVKVAEQMGIANQTILKAWRRRTASGTYRHEGGDHPNLGCLNCHHLEKMNTLDRTRPSVTVESCGGAEGCHVTATADDGGILNYEIDQKKTNASYVCTKCHISFGKSVIPETHAKAVNVLKK